MGDILRIRLLRQIDPQEARVYLLYRVWYLYLSGQALAAIMLHRWLLPMALATIIRWWLVDHPIIRGGRVEIGGGGIGLTAATHVGIRAIPSIVAAVIGVAIAGLIGQLGS